MNNYEPIIGLEIHVELKTKSKMFCQCEADYFGKPANSNTCPVCLGMPGALPVPNKKAVEWTLRIGKALNCTINRVSKFDRKHYFYPDLPKGYQISQYDEPIAVNGKVKTGNKTFGITRVHLEEDTGKLLHVGGDTLVDFNRSGVPLVEIVTEPDFRSSEEVKKFLEELHAIIRALDVSDADMEKGSMRLEPNISVRKAGELDLPSYKVEIKNINSFNFVKRAIDYEIERHVNLIGKGINIKQETRGYVEKTNSTVVQRSKEEAHDYRYFPEPDIPPLLFEKAYIDSIEVQELPQQKQERYISQGVRVNEARLLSISTTESMLYENITDLLKKDPLMKDVNIYQGTANLIINKKIDVTEGADKVIAIVRELLTPKKTDANKLSESIGKVITANPKAVDDFRKGKTNVIMFLVGQVMREMRGQADANKVKEELVKILS